MLKTKFTKGVEHKPIVNISKQIPRIVKAVTLNFAAGWLLSNSFMIFMKMYFMAFHIALVFDSSP